MSFLCDNAIITGIVTAWNVSPMITPLTLIYQLDVPNQTSGTAHNSLILIQNLK